MPIPARLLRNGRPMTRFTISLGAVLAPSLLLTAVACGGSAPSDAGSGGTTLDGFFTGGNGNSGGAQNGSGGSTSSGGGSATGGSATGGNSSSGGSGGLPNSQCSDEETCTAGASCYAPGSPPPIICGAPGWCGGCNCPTEPTYPSGDGQTCEDLTDCPTPSDTVPRAASICDPATSQCTECLTGEDCGAMPYCALGAASNGRMCFQCSVDGDCGGDSPVCYKYTSGFGTDEYGYCRQCRVTADCPTGVCTIDGACVPGCENDGPCGPNRLCNLQTERCEPQPCLGDSDCSPQSTCEEACTAKSCTSDAGCPGGYCVDGSCYETPGSCIFDTAG